MCSMQRTDSGVGLGRRISRVVTLRGKATSRHRGNVFFRRPLHRVSVRAGLAELRARILGGRANLTASRQAITVHKPPSLRIVFALTFRLRHTALGFRTFRGDGTVQIGSAWPRVRSAKGESLQRFRRRIGRRSASSVIECSPIRAPGTQPSARAK